MASTEGLMPITRAFLSSYYDKYPFSPLSQDVSRLTDEIHSMAKNLQKDAPLTEGESSLVLEAESHPPHKVDENLWKNREQLEEILFLFESSNWPPALQLQSTTEDVELVSVLERLGEKFRSTLKSLQTFQSKNSEFVFNTVMTYMPQDFRGTLIRQQRERSERNKQAEVDALINSGGSIRDRYALLWNQQMERRRQLAIALYRIVLPLRRNTTQLVKGETSFNCCVAMALILHSTDNNKNASKALIAAEYTGVKVDLAKDFQMGVSNKTPEFLEMNPIGKVPVLQTPDGPVFESNAIARYVTKTKPNNPLFGSSLIEYAQIEQWNDFSATEIDANIARWLYPRLGYAVYISQAEEGAVAALKRALGALNTHLASNTYLVGHCITLADIIMVCNLSIGFRMILTKSFTKEFPHVERYFWTVVNQPSFVKILGEVKQAESIPAVQSKPAQPEKLKAKEEPKKEVKKEEPSPVEEEAAPKPKAKNPLDLLPPSKMILDDWKRLYSNTKTNFREVAVKGFWDMYDPEGYSLWFCDYKYNDENTVSFVTLNKVGGFLQRMDLVRKYAFGKMLVVGSEAPFKVQGLWLFRGKEIPKFVMEEVYDMELYEWKEVDINDEAQKERVSQMIEDHEPFEGQALLDAKCFK